MNNSRLKIRIRKWSSFRLFYRHIVFFSFLVSILLFVAGVPIASIDDMPVDQVFGLQTIFYQLSMEFPTFSFLGALGLTHYVQKNQYYFYRNQGTSIISLIIFSWIANCVLGLIFLLTSFLWSING